MAKLKNIIKQLSEHDYKQIYESLLESNADKSALLLKYMHQDNYSDTKIIKELNVNNNAYYTLRSRLNQKIEEHLLEQIESPRTDLLRKVANINEIIFTKKRTIAITTLKKLEKALKDYDLSNELVAVYKALKKLHINTNDYFEYSRLFNQNVAYTSAVDKVESLLVEYFNKYGNYSFSGDEASKLELNLLNNEIINNCKMYDLDISHRLYVYQSFVNVFHRLFVDIENDGYDENIEPIEDIFTKVEKIFEMYPQDPVYFHLHIILEYLRLEYYNHYKLFRKAETYFAEVNDVIASLLSSYNFYTYPTRFLFTKLERSARMNKQQELAEENEALFMNYEADKENIPEYVSYISYRAISFYYADKYDEATKWLNSLLNEISLKKYPYVHLEIKLFLAIQYCLLNDNDLFVQLMNSIQRQIRILGKETCGHAVLLGKTLKVANQTNRQEREAKIRELLDKLKNTGLRTGFNLTRYIKFDDSFISKLMKKK